MYYHIDHYFAQNFRSLLFIMRYSFTSLALLAGITVSSFAQDCDPNAPFVLEPYDGETTEDPGMTSQLIDYWSESTCYKMSDGSQPNIKEQCKDICIPGGGEDEGEGEDEDKKKTVTSSQSCIFGDAPWSDARTGKPLLCGTDKDFQGTSLLRQPSAKLWSSNIDIISRNDDHDWILLMQSTHP